MLTIESMKEILTKDMQKFEIWKAPMSCPYKFRGYNMNAFDLNDYVHVYSGKIDVDPKDESVNRSVKTLDRLYYMFNMKHPDDYYSSSLSVSDVICLNYDGYREWYYVNDFGFMKLNNLNLRK